MNERLRVTSVIAIASFVSILKYLQPALRLFSSVLIWHSDRRDLFRLLRHRHGVSRDFFYDIITVFCFDCFQQITMHRRIRRVCSGASAVVANATDPQQGAGTASAVSTWACAQAAGAETVKTAGAVPWAAPTARRRQGRTSWRDPAQLRMTLFTSRDGWDSSVGWL